MRQVRDTLIWLAMISIVLGVIYVMPQVATYVDAASGGDTDRVGATGRELTVPFRQELSHHHH